MIKNLFKWRFSNFIWKFPFIVDFSIERWWLVWFQFFGTKTEKWRWTLQLPGRALPGKAQDIPLVCVYEISWISAGGNTNPDVLRNSSAKSSGKSNWFQGGKPKTSTIQPRVNQITSCSQLSKPNRKSHGNQHVWLKKMLNWLNPVKSHKIPWKNPIKKQCFTGWSETPTPKPMRTTCAVAWGPPCGRGPKPMSRAVRTSLRMGRRERGCSCRPVELPTPQLNSHGWWRFDGSPTSGHRDVHCGNTPGSVFVDCFTPLRVG